MVFKQTTDFESRKCGVFFLFSYSLRLCLRVRNVLRSVEILRTALDSVAQLQRKLRQGAELCFIKGLVALLRIMSVAQFSVLSSSRNLCLEWVSSEGISSCSLDAENTSWIHVLGAEKKGKSTNIHESSTCMSSCPHHKGKGGIRRGSSIEF